MYNRNGYNYFWSVHNFKDVLDKSSIVNNPSLVHTPDFLFHILTCLLIWLEMNYLISMNVKVITL